MLAGRLLGILDLAALFCITLVFFDMSPAKILIWGIAYLLIKGFMFRLDPNSWFDIGIAIYGILLIFGLKFSVIYVFVLLYLAQKGLLSLV